MTYDFTNKIYQQKIIEFMVNFIPVGKIKLFICIQSNVLRKTFK